MAQGLHRFTVIALLSATLPLVQCTELTKVDWTLIAGAGTGGGASGTPNSAGDTSAAEEPAGAGGTASGGIGD